MICRLCGGTALPFSTVRGRAYERCPACGYVGLLRRSFPSREAERARYLAHRNDPAEPGYRGFLEAFLDRVLPRGLDPATRILDFGSGPRPALVELLRGRGFSAVEAYDPCFAPGSSWRRRSYGLVLVHEVAEHLREPGRSLRALAGRLVPGGLLAVRTRFLPGSAEAFAAWWYREDETHLGFFAPESLRALAASAGLGLRTLEAPDLAVLEAPGGRGGAAATPYIA